MINLYLTIVSLFILSCNGEQTAFKSPVGYDLASPEKFVMPEALLEISGINFHQDTLFAVQDEEGKLFYLQPGDKKAGSTKFAKSGDYEDLAIFRDRVIILRSDGTLFSFPLAEVRLEEATGAQEWKDLVPKGEYEGLCADETNDLLYVLCKDCKDDKASEATSVYMLQVQPDGSITKKGSSSVDVKKIETLGGGKKLKFFPSAVAKNPQRQEWYILSSANKMLVIADQTWSVKEVYPLDPAHFRQPEGIAFDRQNNLYISNEGDAVSNGNVLKFVFKQVN